LTIKGWHEYVLMFVRELDLSYYNPLGRSGLLVVRYVRWMRRSVLCWIITCFLAVEAPRC
jgi:hypothetical protein